MKNLPKYNHLRAAIFLTSFLALTYLFQTPVYCQNPILIRPPIVRPVPTSVPTVKTGRQVTDVSKIKQLPDLQIAEITYDKCVVNIRVINGGLKPSGPFNVWINLIGIGKATDRLAMKNPYVSTYWHLEPGAEAWLPLNLMSIEASFQGGVSGSYCNFADVTKIRAVVDARYLYYTEDNAVRDLYKPGSAVPGGMKVAESKVEESDENNNELSVKKADIKALSVKPY